jgi:hypothetical protein
VLRVYISEEGNMLIAEKFIRSPVSKYGIHIFYNHDGTWYPEVNKVLKLKDYLHSSLGKSLIDGRDQPIFERQNRKF